LGRFCSPDGGLLGVDTCARNRRAASRRRATSSAGATRSSSSRSRSASAPTSGGVGSIGRAMAEIVAQQLPSCTQRSDNGSFGPDCFREASKRPLGSDARLPEPRPRGAASDRSDTAPAGFVSESAGILSSMKQPTACAPIGRARRSPPNPVIAGHSGPQATEEQQERADRSESRTNAHERAGGWYTRAPAARSRGTARTAPTVSPRQRIAQFCAILRIYALAGGDRSEASFSQQESTSHTAALVSRHAAVPCDSWVNKRVHTCSERAPGARNAKVNRAICRALTKSTRSLSQHQSQPKPQRT
jgi:hypothetical protein